MDVATMLRRGPSRSALVVIHSMNLDGAARIRTVLPDAHAIPFVHLDARTRVYSRLRSACAARDLTGLERVLREWSNT